MKTRNGAFASVTLSTLVAIAFSGIAAGQTFKKVNVKAGVKLTQIAAGSTMIWGLSVNGQPYVSKGKAFVPASTMTFTEVAVGGGNLRQPDTVWALDSAGQIYNATVAANIWTFNLMPGVLSHLALGPGYQDKCHPYEVWGVNPSALIYRFNYCIGNWDNVSGTLQSIVIGGGNVYGVNGNKEVYQFNFKTAAFERIGIYHNYLEDQIFAGPNGVLGLIGGHPEIYVQPFVDSFADLDLGTGFSQLAGGGDGIWALDTSGRVYRFQTDPWQLVQIPGVLFTTLSVGSGGGVWGIDFSGNVWAFSTP